MTPYSPGAGNPAYNFLDMTPACHFPLSLSLSPPLFHSEPGVEFGKVKSITIGQWTRCILFRPTGCPSHSSIDKQLAYFTRSVKIDNDLTMSSVDKKVCRKVKSLLKCFSSLKICKTSLLTHSI